jgi:2-phospho-L-lactate guanylyltransferase
MTIWAVIPVKPLEESKTRLAHLLAANQRADLMRCFLQNALLTLNYVPAVGRILVISSDSEVLTLARQYGAMTMAEAQPQGLNKAVTRAAGYAAGQKAAALLILPADLPFMQTADIERMLAVLNEERNGPILAICTDDRQDGTNALLLAPPAPFTFHYGLGSFRQHLQEAARQGYTPHLIAAPGLQFDLDTEADWQIYREVSGVRC